MAMFKKYREHSGYTRACLHIFVLGKTSLLNREDKSPPYSV